MARKRTRRRPKAVETDLPDPYREDWLKLTPRERLRRSWQLRARIKNLQAVHDAKSLPEL